MKTIYKWVGGKTKLLPQIKELFPEKYNNYYEPFFGGGALFFDLEKANSFISDTNEELINFLVQVRDHPENLLVESDKHINERSYYMSIRNWDREDNWKNKYTLLQRAGRFIYLNKTSFSGMWRVNKNKQHNAGFAGYTSARLTQKREKFILREYLIKASKLLKSTDIKCQSYNTINPQARDLVYLDPPYDNAEDPYSPGKFSQKSLFNFCENLKAFFILSNRATDNIYELYKDYTIIEIPSKQSFSSTTKKPNDVLITNG